MDRVRTVVRFMLPQDAAVAVLTGGDDELLDVGLSARHLWPGRDDGVPKDWSDVAGLEALRRARVDFVVVPETAYELLERHEGLADHLRGELRLVIREEGVCTIFAVDKAEQPPPFNPPDHLPLPPPELIRVVMHEDKQRGYWMLGALGADCIRRMLERHGMELSDLDAVLDFGCGCGRMMRHWKWARGPELHGTDYNPYLVRWCRENLPFGTYGVNDVVPPLEYADETFDFIYAISVFTHMEETQQHAWMEELARVLRPSGTLYLTVHGEGRLGRLDEEERRRFAAGELVVVEPERASTNACAAYHPERYVKEVLSRGFEILETVPNGAEDVRQDAYLLRKSAQLS